MSETAAADTRSVEVLRQHLIDPEICIRCNTCEETCPIDAVTHDDNNYVVNAEICNYCMDCIAPCPTGAIDNWRVVATPYSLDEQFSWSDLPQQQELASGDSGGARTDDQNVEVGLASGAGKCRARDRGDQTAYGTPARQFEGFQCRRH